MKKYIMTVTTIALIFTLLLPAACTEKAEFRESALSISPAETISGAPAVVTVDVENIGSGDGIYRAVLTIDDKTEEVKEVILTPGARETVTFSITMETPGSYRVGVNELSGTVEVLAPLLIVERAYKAMEGIRSLQADMVMEIELESAIEDESFDMAMLMDIEMAVDFEARQLKMIYIMRMGVSDTEEEEMTIETYLIGDTAYVKMEAPGETGDWECEEATIEVWDEMLTVQDQMYVSLDVLEGAEVDFIGTEVVDGVDCYVFDFIIAEDAYMDAIRSQLQTGPLGDIDMFDFDEAIASAIFLKLMDISMQQWIAVDGRYIKKVDMLIEMDLEPLIYMKIDMEVNSQKPNAPVVIEPPAEALASCE